MRRYATLAERYGPFALVTVVGLWLLWPIPAGEMPLSADHTVHLTRVWLFADQLAQGQVRGWSPVWFFGTPVGDLYPVLGDLLIVGVRALSLGLLEWPQAYAVGFSLVFVAQGWAMLRAGNAMKLGPVPGLIAALLILADVGAYREGGWIYTVAYGVWPQTLANALGWLALSELMVATTAEQPARARRGIALAALALAGSLLAHPVSMLFIAVAGPIAVITAGGLDRAKLRRAAGSGILVAALGLALAAWWVFPMLSLRGWMASYGWLWQKLAWLVDHAMDGEWAQSMASPVGWTAALGIALVAVAGSRAARAYAACALVFWLASASDLVWGLRLDLVSEGFSHLQYQRLLTSAKPGFFLMVGAVFGFGVALAKRAYERPGPYGRAAAATVALAVAGAGYWVADAQQLISRKNDVGDVQTIRAPKRPEFDEDYAQLVEWMRGEWAQRDRFYRFTVRDSRNTHWFMDAPALADGVPILKQGFTPGDNFVHKPESGKPGVLDRAQVRYEIGRGRRRAGPGHIATFGTITIKERPNWQQQRVAWLEGPGELAVVTDDVAGGNVQVQVSGADESTRLVFAVAGYPRWQLHRDGEAVPWYEAPVVGDGPIATQAQRLAGELRGGKAHGDDGTEPTLLATNAEDGTYVLSYHRWRALDVLAFLMSFAALGAVVSMLWRPDRFTLPTSIVARSRDRLGRFGHPLALGTAVLAMLAVSGWRSSEGAVQSEGLRGVGWTTRGSERDGAWPPATSKSTC